LRVSAAGLPPFGTDMSWRREPVYLKKAKPLDGLLRERPDLPDPNPVRPGPGPEQRLRNLQRRFRAVSERHDRANELRRYYRSAKIAALAAIVAFAVVWGLGSSPWPVMTTLRHIASSPQLWFCPPRRLGAREKGRAGLLEASRSRRGWNRLRTMAATAGRCWNAAAVADLLQR
jgi:hypothetical protein